jgi:hypothetical protein
MNYSDTMPWLHIAGCMGSRWCGGLFNNNSATNALTHDWNKVFISYCDGGSYAGDNDNVTTTTYNGQTVPLYFRGFRNLNAILDDLIANYNFGKASEVIAGGDSAGGT